MYVRHRICGKLGGQVEPEEVVKPVMQLSLSADETECGASDTPDVQ